MFNLTRDELIWIDKSSIGPIVSVQKFEQALTNQVFLLTDENGQQAIFKRLNLQARDLQDRKRELLVQQLAHDNGLSPKVLACCDQYRLQEYITGNTLDGSPVDAQTIELLAAQLQIIHQLPAEHAQPQRLVFELKRLKKQLNNSVDQVEFLQMLNLATALDNSSTRDVLCHGDLSLNNVLRATDGQIKILDWEYAALAGAPYDLAFCCCINGFSAQQQALLISLYYFLHKEHLSCSLAQLEKECALYLSVFSYINELWAACFLANENC